MLWSDGAKECGHTHNDTHTDWNSRATVLMITGDLFIGKVVFICLRVSVNLIYKFQGKPGTTTVKHDFNPNGLKFHRGSP